MRVWVPFPDLIERTGALPAGVDLDVFTGEGDLPDSIGEVELFVAPYLHESKIVGLAEQMPKLRVLQTLTAGVDHLKPYLPQHITLCNGRGIHDASTAELAVALTLMATRSLPRFLRAQDEGRWEHVWSEALADKTVLILGYGSVGAAVERRLAGFEVEVVRVARHRRQDVHAISELPDLLPTADVVILTVPLSDETRGMVDTDFLRRMKDGALLVNVARGPVVDTDALLAELNTGRLRAALDVTDPEPLPDGHPLWSAPGVLITPHVGGNTSAFKPRAYRLAHQQIVRFATGQPLLNIISRDY